MESLWEAIVKIVRVDKEDPIAAWDAHNETLSRAEKILNDKNYEKLIFTGPGTNLEIGLPKGHIWQGGSAVSESGIDRKSTRLNSSHVAISYAVFCLKKK